MKEELGLAVESKEKVVGQTHAAPLETSLQELSQSVVNCDDITFLCCGLQISPLLIVGLLLAQT